MALSMQNADIAVSRQGIQRFMSLLDSNVKTLQRRVYVNSPLFMDVVKTISNYWKGEDADNFVRDLSTGVSEITALFNEIYGRLRSAFDQYYVNFLRMQQSTYQRGSIKIRR